MQWELYGILASLQRDCQLIHEVETVRSGLDALVPSRQPISLTEVRQLVAQLSHDQFRVRQAADRALRAGGCCMLGLLQQIDIEDLDREQQLRLRNICRSLYGQQSDTPERVIAWLTNDKQIWIDRLNAEDLEQRALASSHLAQILGHSIAFEPGGMPGERTRQVAALQTQLSVR